MGALSLIQSVLRDTGSLDECPECGKGTMPAENRCPDCIGDRNL